MRSAGRYGPVRGSAGLAHAGSAADPQIKAVSLRVVAPCCTMLQHSATYYNTVTHCVATYYNTVQHIANQCKLFQRSARGCNMLQHGSTCCNTVQSVATCLRRRATAHGGFRLLSWPSRVVLRRLTHAPQSVAPSSSGARAQRCDNASARNLHSNAKRNVSRCDAPCCAAMHRHLHGVVLSCTVLQGVGDVLQRGALAGTTATRRSSCASNC